MTQQDKFKETLREYYDSQQFSIPEGDWEKTAAHLSKTKQTRLLKRGALVVALLLSLSSICLYLFLPLPTTVISTKALPLKASSQAILTKDTGLPNSVQNPSNNPAPSSTSRQHASVLATEQSASNDQKIKTPTLVQSAAITNPLVNNNPETPPGLFNSSTNENNGPEQTLILSSTITTQLESPPTAIAQVGEQDIAESKNQTVPKAESPQLVQNTQGPKLPLLEAIVETPTNQVVEKLPPAINHQQMSESPDTSGSMRSQPITEVTANQIASAESIHDTLTNVPAKAPDSLVKRILATEGVYYEIGVAGYNGWKVNGGRDARGISPLVGINYMNRLGDRSALSFGVQYITVPNLSISSKTSRIATYGYGEKSSVTVITPSTLQYLALPLRYNYFLDGKTSFGIGLNLAYLLTVDAQVKTYEESPGYTSEVKHIKQSGYVKGFSWFDSQVNVFYRRRFGKSLGAQAEVFYGLMDVKDNDFFKLNATEKNTGLKLSLIYYGLSKNTRP